MGHGSTRRRGGFSLLELLIVIGVLAILVTLIAGAGIRIIAAQRERITLSVLQSLDRAMEEFIAVTGGIPAFPLDQDQLNLLYEDVPGLSSMTPEGFGQFADPYSDIPTLSDGYPVRPDAAVFLRQAQGFDTVRAILEAIPERFLMLTLIDNALPSDQDDLNKEQPSIVDAWGEPTWDNEQPAQGVQQFIYYVHPKNRLAQDVYGKCKNGRPYFMSAGPDKLYGHPSELELIAALYPDVNQSDSVALLRAAREDNLYSYDVDTDFDIDFSIISALLTN